jgi:hypothetical protein
MTNIMPTFTKFLKKIFYGFITGMVIAICLTILAFMLPVLWTFGIMFAAAYPTLAFTMIVTLIGIAVNVWLY